MEFTATDVNCEPAAQPETEGSRLSIAILVYLLGLLVWSLLYNISSPNARMHAAPLQREDSPTAAVYMMIRTAPRPAICV